ncbi:hypothetical protein [Cytobacillus purgationiresistens]|uniref:Uncharacterized protein n=1 Tax=Cytobacillus purgationiresistens TaxID=863449 RepID=A0ABU0ARX6_9BACI|nr:hypothetical protein [Cytobacillus purgationiresistens]MDQ0273531.1 hypothetical protein [Cytobacillus purgationiresistens]
MKIPKFLFPYIFILFLISGCSERTVEFNELYDGDLSKIEKITIVDGSSGYSIIINSKDDISALIDEPNSATYTLTNIDKDEINGTLFGVAFYEKANHTDPVFTMTTNVTDHKVFESNADLATIFS